MASPVLVEARRTMHLTLSTRTVAEAGGPPVTLRARDAALLAWLALEGATPRARLAALLWPDSDAEAAGNALRQRLFQLRRLLGREVVTGSGVLALADGVSHDLVDAAQVLGEAPPIAGGEFAAWLEQQRLRRRAQRRQTLVGRVQAAEDGQDWAEALLQAQALLALDPVSEDAHRRLMRLHYLAGDPAAALLAFDRCERMLKDEVGTRPSAETLALLATVEAGTPPALAAGSVLPASVLRPPRLVGRERELAVLAQAWQTGQVIALVGEAGLGKTRLLQAFVDGQRGVARAAGRPGDAGVPFATLARLLRAVLALGSEPAATALALPMRGEITRVLPEFDGGGARPAGEGQRLVLRRALRGLLASQRGLTGLIVDDLHFADEASLEMIGALIDPDDDASGQPPASSLNWALACRPADAGSPLRALQDGLLEQARMALLVLAPLDEAALAALVDSLRLPGIVGAALAPGLWRRTGGNPLFVLETLKQAWVERTLATLAQADTLPRPVSVGRMIERRLGQLSSGAIAVARVASISGVDFDMALAEHVLGTPVIRLADAVAELEAAQVMRGDAFAHDLVADAVQAGVPATVAVHVHAQVARWLETRSGEPARIARHWMDARQPALALSWLAQAAQAAQRALRAREAIAFLETKSDIEATLGQPERAFDSLLPAAQQAIDMGADGQSDEWQARLDALATTPRQQAQAMMLRAGIHNHRGEGPAAIATGQRALELCEALEDPRLAMACRLTLSDAYSVAGRFGEAAEVMRVCAAWFDAHGDEPERAQVHATLALTLDNLGRLDEAAPHHRCGLDMALRAGDLQGASVRWVNFSRNRTFAGALDDADDAMARAEQLLEPFDSAGAHLPMLLMMRAMLLCQLGRFDSALDKAGRALDVARRWQPGHVDLAHIRLAACWWQLGQWARLSQALAAVEVTAQSSLTVRVGHARMRCAYARATGGSLRDSDSARRTLLDALSVFPKNERPDLRLPLMLELVDGGEPGAMLAQVDEIGAQARAMGFANVQLAAHLRAAELAAGHDPARGRREALAAISLRAQGLQTTAILPAEYWLQVSRALAAAGDRAHAAEVAAEGQGWLQATARDRVPAAFRQSFLERNPVNRALLDGLSAFAPAARVIPK